ncbi:MAG: hypothetical protein ACXVXT_19205 [Blastococcus sp.]
MNPDGPVDRDATDRRFDALVEAFAGRPGVGLPGEGGRRGFGSDALTVHGSIFAMVSRGHLVVKLPASRVAELIGAGAGRPFDAGRGRAMKEWLTVTAEEEQAWRGLAEEACAFAGRR